MIIAFGSALGGLIVLGLGLALGLGGFSLIWYSARMTSEAVAKRVDLVRDRTAPMRIRAPRAEMTVLRPNASGLTVQEQREAIRLFARFGIPPARATDALLASRFAAVGLVAVLAYLATRHLSVFASSRPLHLLVSLGFGLAGWFVPLLLIRRGIKRRAKAIVAGLPDAMELLVICVEAGLAFEDGIDRVVSELQRSQPILAEELALTSADLKILPSRDRALANFAERVQVPSVRTVVTTLAQTMRYGTPLAQALRVVASELRNDSLMRLEERANQLPTLMTIPMMIFIMPTIFLIVGGPAALRMLDAFHH
jgi:tight adherence protein C